jgi:hypothetical protein
LLRLTVSSIPLVAITVASSVGVTVQPAFAQCAPSRSPQSGTWQDGLTRSISIPSDQYGAPTQDAAVLSYIYQYDTYVYGSDQPSAWAMLGKPTQYTTCCWAQVGWWEYTSGGAHHRVNFSQWTHDGTWSESDHAGSAVGATDNYEVYMQSGDFGYWEFWMDGNMIDNAPVSFVPTQALVRGELGQLASQMPGGYNNNSVHEVFSNVGYMQNDSWGSFYGSTQNDSTTYFGNHYNGSNWDAVWDKSCAT